MFLKFIFLQYFFYNIAFRNISTNKLKKIFKLLLLIYITNNFYSQKTKFILIKFLMKLEKSDRLHKMFYMSEHLQLLLMVCTT